MKFFVFACFVVASVARLGASEDIYTLWITNPRGKIAPQIMHLLRRKVPGVQLELYSQNERYRAAPQLPLPVCSVTEYFLFSPAQELMQIGCLDGREPAAVIPAICQAIFEYERAVRTGKAPQVYTMRKMQ